MDMRGTAVSGGTAVERLSSARDAINILKLMVGVWTRHVSQLILQENHAGKDVNPNVKISSV